MQEKVRIGEINPCDAHRKIKSIEAELARTEEEKQELKFRESERLQKKRETIMQR